MPYRCNPYDEIIFLQHFLLFWIKLKNVMVGLCSPKSDLQYREVSFTSTLALLKLENFKEQPFSQIITYIY